MEFWAEIRRKVLAEGVSRREIIRQTGLHWETLRKILKYSRPPGYRRRQPASKPKIGPYLDRIRQIIISDQDQPRRQRHTAKRIWERLREEGFTGGYTLVKDAVREIQATRQEVFMPLVHRPGEAQADFGHAVVRMDGRLIKAAFFVIVLPHSDVFFVMAFPRECTETFWAGHVQAFAFFGFVPRRISYDNAKVQVAGILGPRKRQLTQGFQQLISHYLFAPQFCLVRRANEKGVAEGVVKYTRLNFFVPVPEVRDFDELNRYLRDRCQAELSRRLRGKTVTKAGLLAEDQAAGLALPESPFDGCRTTSAFASSESLVRFDRNDYSVPVDYAHRQLIIRADWKQVTLCYYQQEVATHARCWERERHIFNPLHYLRLVQRKPGSLDYARPLEELQLPMCFETLRRVLEGRRPDGTREYIRVLRLLENHPVESVAQAIEKALSQCLYDRDGIASFLPHTAPWGQTTFRLAGREHLRYVKVMDNEVSTYCQLLAGGVL
jgi:transposase